jgi:hypothetical protein
MCNDTANANVTCNAAMPDHHPLTRLVHLGQAHPSSYSIVEMDSDVSEAWSLLQNFINEAPRASHDFWIAISA